MNPGTSWTTHILHGTESIIQKLCPLQVRMPAARQGLSTSLKPAEACACPSRLERSVHCGIGGGLSRPISTYILVSAGGVCEEPRHGCLHPWLDSGNLLPSPSPPETGWAPCEGIPARPLRRRFLERPSAVTAGPVNGNTSRPSRSPRSYVCPQDVLVGSLTPPYTGECLAPFHVSCVVSFALKSTAGTR